MTASLDAQIDDVVRIASSCDRDTTRAIRQVLGSVGAADASFTFVFYSPEHDADLIAGELASLGHSRSIAGSSAGEISPAGFAHGSITAMALRGSHTRAAVRVVPTLEDFSLLRVSTLAAELARDLGYCTETLDPRRHIWVLLLDGLSGREDFFTPFFATHAPRLPLVGGSFGDESAFAEVTMSHAGRVHTGAGAVMLLEYDRPFEVVHHTHLEFTEHWFEVTDTESGGRQLTGLDGKPAVDVYANALGVTADELTLDVTGSAPFGFRFKGRPFPCSVMRVHGGRIQLAYSVQRGDRLNLLKPVALLQKSHDVVRLAIESLRDAGSSAQGMLAFHCLGRYLEAGRLDVVEELFTAMNQLPIGGLNTYGEQFGSRHMNHSLCGIIFG